MLKYNFPFEVGDEFIPNSIHYPAKKCVVEDIHYAFNEVLYWARQEESGAAKIMLKSKIFNKSEKYQKLTVTELIKLVRQNDRTAVVEYVRRFKKYPKFIKK